MRILLTSRHFFPSAGGVQQSVHELAWRLRARDHDVAVLTRIGSPSARVLMARASRKLLHRKVLLEDRSFEYPVFRCVEPAEGTALALTRLQPDVIVANGGGTRTLQFTRRVLETVNEMDARAPGVLYIRDGHSMSLLEPPAVDVALVLANADHLTAAAAARGWPSAYVPSIVDLEQYCCDSTRRVVLYVNPVPSKGLDIALALAAARPELPFVFQEAWPLDARSRALLTDAIRELDNVELRPVCRDPGRLYGDARVLLAPYHPLEGRPRVVLEAQASGIPVLGSTAPGVAEAIGPGGVAVPLDAPVAAWSEALLSLWTDEGAYERYAMEARRHSRRPAVDPSQVTSRFVTVLEDLLASRATAGQR